MSPWITPGYGGTFKDISHFSNLAIKVELLRRKCSLLFIPLTLQVTTPAAQSVIRRSRRVKVKGLSFQKLQSNIIKLYSLHNLPILTERSFTQPELYPTRQTPILCYWTFILADHFKKHKLIILATEAQLWYILPFYHLKHESFWQGNTRTWFYWELNPFK